MKEGQRHASLAFLLERLRKRWRAEAVIDRHYAGWLRRHGTPDAASWRARLNGLPAAPGISVVMPVFRTQPDWLEEAIASVLAQIHPRWELLIADDASGTNDVRRVLDRVEAADPRIRTVRLTERAGISAASNAALALATQEYVTFLDHDDRLAPHALAAMAVALAAHPDTALAFSDEDQVSGARRVRPYFKPGWNPDLLLSQNLVCHLAVYRLDLVRRLGGLRSAFDGSQDLDLALRAAGAAGSGRVRHVPDVLYHWRQSPGSFSSRDAEVCRAATRRALREALGPGDRVTEDPVLPPWPLVQFGLPAPAPRLSMIGGALPFGSYDPAMIETVASADEAAGDVLVFLAPALEPVTVDWLAVLAAQAMRPGIGVAGARLDGSDGRVVHAGYVLDPRGVAVSPIGAADGEDPGYRGHFHLARTVSAVSSDCMAVRREVFVQEGGFRAEAGDFAAVDLCLRLAARGLRSVWAPQARLRYTAMPKPPQAGAAWMRAQWGSALADDPYHNLNLRLRGGVLSLA
jgi:O-antigen biosynthesis protein